MSTGKNYTSQIKSIKFISPKNSLCFVQLDTWRNGYRRWFPKETIICRFNPDYRRVTIQEYLTLVPGYMIHTFTDKMSFENDTYIPRGGEFLSEN